MFTPWSLVFLIAAVQGFFVALVFWRWKRGHRTANRLLAALVLVFSVILGEYVLHWTGYIRVFPHAIGWYRTLVFLFGPLLWLYLRLIFTRTRPTRADWLHFLPFFLAVLAESPWYLLDAEGKQAVVAGLARHPVRRIFGPLLTWGGIAHLAAYAAWAIVYARRQPSTESVRRWARLLTGFFALFVAADASYFVLVRFAFFNQAWDYHISAAMTLCIYLIAYAGYAQPAVFAGFGLLEPAAPVKYRTSGLTPAARTALLARLQTVMEQEGLYREPALSLEALAARLGAGKHYVSQAINEGLGVSFFEYVNQLRIAEAQRLLSEGGESAAPRVIEVAYAVGFNNKVSFNTAFKRATGLTPTEFRNRRR
jgi:AraC-like DNA-binding protein